jgi:hypothetical protein
VIFKVALEVLAGATRQQKEIKGIQIENDEVKLFKFVEHMLLYTEKYKYYIKIVRNYK